MRSALIVMSLVVMVVLLLVKGKGNVWADDGEQVEQVVVDEEGAVSDGMVVVSEQEWRRLQNEVRQLRRDVDRLKNGGCKTTTVRRPSRNQDASSQESADVLDQDPPAVAAVDASASKSVMNSVGSQEPGALTLEKFIHDCAEYDASMFLKNNTDRKITQFSGRMIYYDMDGNMLDYMDFSHAISIDPGMVKRFEMKAYGYGDDYYYYKSECPVADYGRKYKVKFELKSYKTDSR